MIFAVLLVFTDTLRFIFFFYTSLSIIKINVALPGPGRGGKCLHLPDSLRPEAAAQLSCTECQTVPVRVQVSPEHVLYRGTKREPSAGLRIRIIINPHYL
jgi:hypothetical protein